MFRALLGGGRSRDRSESHSTTDEDGLPLHNAMRRGDTKEVKKLVDRGGEKVVTAVDKQGRNAFHVAGELGDVDMLKLIVKGASSKLESAVTAKDQMSCTPAYMACLKGSKKVLRELVRCGADLQVTNMIGETLLHAPFRSPFMAKGHVSTVSELLFHKLIPINSLNEENQTPLQLACAKGAYDIAILLLNAGADTTIVKAGDPPLFWAIINENPALVRQLLEHGADISQPNSRGQTLMELMNPKCEIYRIVKKHAISRPGGARKLQLLSERVIVATCIADLPVEVLKLVNHSGLAVGDIEANWQAFCGIMQTGTVTLLGSLLRE